MKSLSQVASELNISVITLRRYIKRGKLKASKIGREYVIKDEDLSELLGNPNELAEAHRMVNKALNDTKELKFAVSRHELLKSALEIFKKHKNAELIESVNLDVNIFGYVVTNNYQTTKSRNQWGRFSPIFSGIDENGKNVYYPDPSWIDERMLQHAKNQTKQTTNPISLARYFDLLFEYGKGKDKFQSGIDAITNYLLAADIEFANNWGFEFIDSLTRALELSIVLKQKNSTDEIIEKFYQFIDKLNSEGNPRFSLELLKTLVYGISLLTEQQRANLVFQARRASEYFGKQKGEQRHIERGFLEVIKSLHHATQEEFKEKEITLEIAKSFINEANERSGNSLARAHLLEEALELVQNLGDPERQADELRHQIELAYLGVEAEMKPVVGEIQITEKERLDFVASIFVEDNIESLRRIGAHPQLLPSFKNSEKQTKNLMEKFPLQYMFGTEILQNGRKISSSQGGLQLTEDHVVQNMGHNLSVNSLFLSFLFDELKKRQVTAAIIIDYLKDQTLFKYDNFEAVAEGIKSFEEGKYYQAITTLVPQIEEMLRLSLRQVGYPTMRTIDGKQQAIYIKEVLDAPPLRSFLTDDQYWYLRLIMYDKRGPGLRDEVSHGFLKVSPTNRMQCYLVMHIILMLATFTIKQNKADAN